MLTATGPGIGRLLMNAAHEHVTTNLRISLSVDPENPARQLYESLGYADYEPGDGLDRMVLGLAD